MIVVWVGIVIEDREREVVRFNIYFVGRIDRIC